MASVWDIFNKSYWKTRKPTELEMLKRIHGRLGWIIFWLIIIALGIGVFKDLL